MTDRLFLGLDAGTQSLKALAVDARLKPTAGFAVNFDRDLPRFKTSGGVHRHPDGLTVTAPALMWVAALDRLLDTMLAADFPFERVAAVSGSGQQHGSVFLAGGVAELLGGLDANRPMMPQLEGLPVLRDSPVWMDSSTAEQCQALEDALGGPGPLAELTGSRACERFTASQIAKVYQTQPRRYELTARIALVSSFMAGLMTGKPAPIDFSDGSGMNLLDIRRRQWSDAALAACAPGLATRLGVPVPSHCDIGPVSPYLVRRCKFRPTCRIIAFSGDNPNSLAGLKLQQSGDIAVSMGTSDTVFGSLNEPRPSADEGHVFANPIDPAGFMALICFKNGSLTREWVRDLCGDADWPSFGARLERTPPGNRGRIGFFFKEPEITPRINQSGCWRFDARNEPAADFDADGEARALIEGRFLSMRLHAQRLGIRPRRLLATGGASVNPAMLRVMADVFGVPVAVINQRDSAALGAAYRALHGLRCRQAGRFVAFADAMPAAARPRIAAEPDPAAHAVYAALLQRYERLENQVLSSLPPEHIPAGPERHQPLL